MPNGSFKGKVESQCPFYRSDDGKRKRIACEGIVARSTLATTFFKRADYDTQLSVFCCEHYKKCEIYRMIMENKYSEEE